MTSSKDSFARKYNTEEFWQTVKQHELSNLSSGSQDSYTSSGLQVLVNMYDDYSDTGSFFDQFGPGMFCNPKAYEALIQMRKELEAKGQWKKWCEDPKYMAKNKQNGKNTKNGVPNTILDGVLKLYYYWKKYTDLLEAVSKSANTQASKFLNAELTGQERFQIWFGAPGTGKSYQLNQIIAQKSVPVVRTTLYPDYTYQDFVGSIMPELKDGKVHYQFEPGVFTKALMLAANSQSDVVLVVEEMNRAKIASVFGDIFQLLDLNEAGESQYPISNPQLSQYLQEKGCESVLRDDGQQIVVPKNLYIWGTMNTSDQNVYVMDTTFKRRFAFKYVSTQQSQSNNDNESQSFENQFGLPWGEFYQLLDQYIVSDLRLSEDKQLGYYFLNFEHAKGDREAAAKEHDRSQICDKLLLYLWQDVDRPASRMNGNRLFKAQSFSGLMKDYQDNQLDEKKIFADDFRTQLKKHLDQEVNQPAVDKPAENEALNPEEDQ